MPLENLLVSSRQQHHACEGATPMRNFHPLHEDAADQRHQYPSDFKRILRGCLHIICSHPVYQLPCFILQQVVILSCHENEMAGVAVR